MIHVCAHTQTAAYKMRVKNGKICQVFTFSSFDFLLCLHENYTHFSSLTQDVVTYAARCRDADSPATTLRDKKQSMREMLK